MTTVDTKTVSAAAAASDSKTAVVAKRKPVFTKVEQLKPGTNGHTLTVMVLTSKTVLQKGRAASALLTRAIPRSPSL
ncbi:Uncharacterized protein M6B38_242815 [Iris pallida]|uniref:Single-stranded DNA binding protein Ssb-like OB fold domain-containing protein n=1 Tax=Iris pallida TaxID=29817 RepID=A0AAX6DK06_IRIPA|nr:Uncharacterized protein M6B38_242815 [Iris pallida]